VRQGHEKVVRQLLKAGAKVDAADVDHCTALHYACKEGFAKIVELLVGAKAILEVADKFYRTPLHYAVLKQSKPITQVLITAGARSDVYDIKEATPIMYATKFKNIELVNILKRVTGDVIDVVDKGREQALTLIKQVRLTSSLSLSFLVEQMNDTGLQ